MVVFEVHLVITVGATRAVPATTLAQKGKMSVVSLVGTTRISSQ